MSHARTAQPTSRNAVSHRQLLVYLGSIAVGLFAAVVWICLATLAPVKQQSKNNEKRLDRTEGRIEKRLDRIESGVNELRNGLLKK